MSKKHLVFIINPKSGVDREKAIQQAIDDKLDNRQFSYEIMHTRYAKHGTELARQAAEQGAYAVVAVGGDGSVNDIVAGLIGTKTVLAIIPKGSGNGMARTMEIPLKEHEAIGSPCRNRRCGRRYYNHAYIRKSLLDRCKTAATHYP